MSRILTVVRQHRADVLRGEREASARMTRAYSVMWERVQSDSDHLLKAIGDLRAVGEDVPLSWLYQEGRLRALKMQIEDHLRTFASHASMIIDQSQQRAIAAARSHSADTMIGPAGQVVSSLEPAVASSFARVSTDAVANVVGALDSTSPLGRLLARLPDDGAKAIGDALLRGFATGRGPKAIARDMRNEAGITLQRAQTISRTETMRAYRAAALERFRQSSIVTGWIWFAALSPETCVACIAMHGTRHPLSEEMSSHPNCRCVPLEETQDTPEVRTGEDWFAEQDAETQAAIMGSKAQELYASGNVPLSDFVGVKDSAEWGPMHYALPLKDVAANTGLDIAP